MSLVQVKEYTDPAALLADAARRRALFYPARTVVVLPRAAEPKEKAIAVEAVKEALQPPPAPRVSSYIALRRLIRAYRADTKLYSQVAISVVKPSSPVVIKAIIAEVASRAGVSVNDILSASRAVSVVQARHLAIWIAARETPLSLPRLGQLFGNRDHTTILHAIRRENERRGANVRGCGRGWKRTS